MMKIHTDPNNLPEFSNSVLTIGAFDGVHKGHSTILTLLKETALQYGGETVVITFYPHPRQVIPHQNHKVSLINTFQEKISLLENNGIDHLVVVPFTQEFSAYSADEYISNFLVEKFKPTIIVIGHDHKFGKNRSGDFTLLEKRSLQYHYQVIEIPEQVINSVAISSTKIREHIISGEIEKANELLGYPFFFSGTVIHGKRIGTTIGFPTANIMINDEDKIIPGNAVYAVEVEIESLNKKYKGMMNIGVRPTFDGSERAIEIHIFEFNESIYEKNISVTIMSKLRSEKKFNSVDELITQLNLDKQVARSIL